MPTLEFLKNIKKPRIPIELRGHQEKIWEPFLKIVRNKEMNIDGEITSKILRAGPCPGNSRIYHIIVGPPRRNERSPLSLFGIQIPGKRKAGIVLEKKWIDNANKALNQWLTTKDIRVFKNLNVPKKIKTHYIERLNEIESIMNELGLTPDQVKMEVQYNVDVQDEETSPILAKLTEINPDGVWIHLPPTYPGAVFESKISLPKDESHKNIALGYAVYVENHEDIDIDYGIFLTVSENGDEIFINSIMLTDPLRGMIIENLKKFKYLIAESKITGRWREGNTLKENLVEPSPPDEPTAICEVCFYKDNCFGGDNEG